MQVELRAPITGILIGRIKERRVGSDLDIWGASETGYILIDPTQYFRFKFNQVNDTVTAIERRRSVNCG